jgi:uncharacterized protein (TIGR02145 family)
LHNAVKIECYFSVLCERLAMMFLVLAGNVSSGSFNNRGTNGILWSSSESGANAWYRNVNSGSAQVNRNANDKSNGLSVRCLKNSLGKRRLKHDAFLCIK